MGNLGATEEKERIGQVFDQLFFIGYWMFGFAGICLLELLNPFVELAFGKKYLFQKEIVLILCVNFFINGMRRAVLIFKESMGLFWYDRYKAVAEAVLNLVISILLVTSFGVAGVFAGTFASTVLTSVWVEPYVIYKYRLQKPVSGFFKMYAGYLAVMASVWVVTEGICCLVSRRTVSADGAENGDLPAGAEPAAVDRLPEDGKMPETDGTAEKNRRKSADGK